MLAYRQPGFSWFFYGIGDYDGNSGGKQDLASGRGKSPERTGLRRRAGVRIFVDFHQWLD